MRYALGTVWQDVQRVIPHPVMEQWLRVAPVKSTVCWCGTSRVSCILRCLTPSVRSANNQ
ncbi:hypothetical protein PLUA15_240156 [Pseudomonas lundensis]|uniref:Uncharacterized protein n=1 Tax=Pseudomonas lundensis TaxID=86185 RepID=A0AAX2H7H3_9PSED|nr:hypothetical protein PLUA15_240156 [Pseudomonas lundensis]